MVEGDYGMVTLSGRVGGSQRRGHRAGPCAGEAVSLTILGLVTLEGTARVGWSRVKGRSRGWAEKGQGGGRYILRSAGSGIVAVCIAENSLSLSYVRRGFVGRVMGRLGGKRLQWEEQG